MQSYNCCICKDSFTDTKDILYPIKSDGTNCSHCLCEKECALTLIDSALTGKSAVSFLKCQFKDCPASYTLDQMETLTIKRRKFISEFEKLVELRIKHTFIQQKQADEVLL